MTEYLKLDSTRLTLAECWRCKRGPGFLVLAVMKLVGKRVGTMVLVPATPTVEKVDPGTQPPELAAALAEPIRECEARGRKLEFWYRIPMLGPFVTLGAALAAADGLSIAMGVASQSRDGSVRDRILGLASRLQNGGYLTTGPGNSLFDPPPEAEPLRLPGRPFLELITAHDARVAARGHHGAGEGDGRAARRDSREGWARTPLSLQIT